MLAVACAAPAGCRVEPRVDVDVDADGSGRVRVTVALDREAQDRLGDVAQLRTADLTEAGWDVSAPEQDASGLVLRASKAFRSRDDLPRVLGEVAGPGGVLSDATLEIDDGWRSTTYRFAASLASSGSADQFSDSDLAAVLDGLPLGRTPDELAADGTGPVALDVVVHLPGETDGSSEQSVVVAGGAASSGAMSVTSEVSKSGPVWWFVGAVGAALAAVVLARRRRVVTVSAVAVDEDEVPPA